MKEKTCRGFPRQQLPLSKKTKEWRTQCVDWASNNTYFTNETVRKSIRHKNINYKLIDGILTMSDLQYIVNPTNISAEFIPDKIQHYPIMNSKLNILRGEESARVFDYKVVVTNPTAISEAETRKKEALFARLQETIQDTAQSDEDYQRAIEDLNRYFTYEWQDIREMQANCLLNHYSKELNMPFIFNQGFMDGMICGEEIYQCDIVGGEPTMVKLDPLKVHIFKSGYSNRIEDADMIILEDYWSPGKIIDTYYDVLSKKAMEYIETMPDSYDAPTDEMDEYDPRYSFIPIGETDDAFVSTSGDYFTAGGLFGETVDNASMPYDIAGNIRVLRVYWKSRRKIKRIKSYNPMTGEPEYTFYPEAYIADTDRGEEEECFWINEAWEGTKIGKDIYVNMRPRPVQYNRLSNPSRCHFGIVGSIYSMNGRSPFSMVDMMKPYNYLYDVIHDRLNRLLAENLGKIIRLDLAKVPKGWKIDKWMYYIKVHHIMVEDSFREGNMGAATGKLAGGLNNNSSGALDVELGNTIQQYMNLLEFIKNEMAEVAGISKQREGQISNRETVGGVERATLQSSHITEWLFVHHEDTKKRVMECFLETAKIAFRGTSKKFQNILPDIAIKAVEIDGDDFAEADYGLVVDNSNSTQELAQKMDMLAQAALQTQVIDFSTIMSLYSSASLAEKRVLVRRNEQEMRERMQQQQQAEMQAKQQETEAQMQMKQAELQLKDNMNIRDNETSLLIANIQALSNQDPEGDGITATQDRDKLLESIREFDEKMKLEREKIKSSEKMNRENNEMRLKIAKSKPKTTSNK